MPPAVDPTPEAAADERTAAYFARLRPLASTYMRDRGAEGRSVERIAVVGNQPLAPSETRAALIDSADVVFRVNGFRLDDEDAEPTVGRRADVVVFNRGVRPTPWFFQDYTERLYLLIEPGTMHWENPKVPQFWPSDLGFVTMPNREVIIPLNRDIGLDSGVDGHWATTGTTMLWIAAQLFPEAHIDASGFSFVDDPEQTAWAHAYGDASAVGEEHRIASEAALFRRWIDSGRIAFHR